MNASTGYSVRTVLDGAYIVQGSSLLITNGLLFGTILYHSALREEKQYLIVAALALSDTLLGCGTVAAAVWRLPGNLANHFDQITQWSCFMSPHNLLWVFATPISALLMLLTSGDRLLLVLDPMRYLSLNVTYVHAAVGCIYALGFSQLLYFGYNVRAAAPNLVSGVCSARWSVVIENYNFYQTTTVWCIALSIVMYICLIAAYGRRVNKVIDQQHEAALKTKLERQHKLTRALFVSSLCDVCFYAMPNGILWLMSRVPNHTFPVWFGPTMWLMTGFNPLMNPFVIFVKQVEVRKGFYAFFKCKILPPNLDNWNI